jgi:hypothetical protein
MQWWQVQQEECHPQGPVKVYPGFPERGYAISGKKLEVDDPTLRADEQGNNVYDTTTELYTTEPNHPAYEYSTLDTTD